jgi:hypothetical protein
MQCIQHMTVVFDYYTRESYPRYLLEEFGDSLGHPAIMVWLEISQIIIRLRHLGGKSAAAETWCPGCSIVVESLQLKFNQGTVFRRWG